MLKHFTFPDASFERKMTLGSAILLYMLILGPYLLPGFIMISGRAEQPSVEKCVFCLFLYFFGVTLMLGSDGQKYFSLWIKRELISDGFFKYTWNPNYLGEIMVYASFATLVGSCLVWTHFIFVWSFIFTMRMVVKDVSLSKKKGWNKYASHSWMLLPKFFGSSLLSIIIYTIILTFGFGLYQVGGV